MVEQWVQLVVAMEQAEHGWAQETHRKLLPAIWPIGQVSLHIVVPTIR
jgi:hypothetical protein